MNGDDEILMQEQRVRVSALSARASATGDTEMRDRLGQAIFLATTAENVRESAETLRYLLDVIEAEEAGADATPPT